MTDIAALVERLRYWSGHSVPTSNAAIIRYRDMWDMTQEAAAALEACQGEMLDTKDRADNAEFDRDEWRKLAEMADEEINELRRLLVIAGGIRALNERNPT